MLGRQREPRANPAPESENIHHMFAPMFRIADQALTLHIDDEILGFQGDLPNQDREVVGDLADVESAFAPLDCQPHDPIERRKGVGSNLVRHDIRAPIFRKNLCYSYRLRLLPAWFLRLSESMAKRKANQLRDSDIVGLKYFDRLMPLLERLHDVGAQRDRAGNRQLFFDHYRAYILLFLFNPIVDSPRGIQQASELKKAQKKLGCPRAALGSLSEAVEVFDPEPVKQIASELAAQLEPLGNNRAFPEVKHLVTAVDGTGRQDPRSHRASGLLKIAHRRPIPQRLALAHSLRRRTRPAGSHRRHRRGHSGRKRRTGGLTQDAAG